MSTHIWLASLTHDLSRQCLAGATFRFLSHTLYFIRGYHDTQALGIIVTHIAGYISLLMVSDLYTSTLIFASYLPLHQHDHLPHLFPPHTSLPGTPRR